MPRVKFDYIVSFSSEDPEHPASNLLSWEVSKKKWLCAAGETSASIVLQLTKAVQISTVAVGAHQAALVEVLVGRSETPADPYQVLVASSVFLSPSESRKAEGAGAERVRTFSGTEGVWAQRWDRLRLIVSQPYNKHCKFGLSFVHVFSPDAAPAPAPAAPALALAALPSSDEEDEFRPGELFAQHLTQPHANNTLDTGSQIRRATSQVLRTSTDSAARLVKTSRSKQTDTHARNAHTQHDANVSTTNDRTVDRVERNERDSERNERDSERNERDSERNERDSKRNERGNERDSQRNQRNERDSKRKRDTSTEGDNENKRKKDSSNERDKVNENEPGTSRDKRNADRDTSTDKIKEYREKTKTDTLKQKRSVSPQTVLAGVVCVLSGYEHPRRGAVRDAALAVGARVQRDWTPACTHLICAFPRTPKLRAVRAGAGGARVPAVTAEWVEQCARLRRRLPEEWFSTEPERRVPVPPGGLDPPEGDAGAEVESESEDTDDEIERVLRRQRDAGSPHAAAHADDRGQGSASTSSEDEWGGTTEGEERTSDEEEVGIEPARARALPPLLRDMVFVAPLAPRLDRYVRAYAGTILPPEEVEAAGGGAVYALCAGAGAGATGVRRLRARWLWRAHADRALPPLQDYLLD